MAGGIEINRRKLLIGGGAGIGLILLWSVWPRRYEPNLSVREGEHILGAYLKIASDGQITVVVPQCEMGQGVYTVLPQILADELGADWRTIAVQAAPLNPLYANSLIAEKWAPTMLPPGAMPDADSDAMRWLSDTAAARSQFMLTAQSSAIPAFGAQFREAGAAARVLLSMAAAEQWDVTWESCEVENGLVKNGSKSLRFGELAMRAAEMELPDPVPLRASPVNNLVGQDVPRLDLPSKLDGSANFAGDIRLPDMVYASIRQGPIGDTILTSYNREGASKITGLIDVIEDERWIAAIGTNWWAANRALDAMSPIFETTGVLADSEKMDAALAEALKSGPGVRFVERGDIAHNFEKFGSLRGEFEANAALHAPMETRTATAHFVDGRLNLWMATQAPAHATRLAAEAIGISPSRVTVFPMMAGGSFGRGLDNDIAGQVAVLAQKMERPVQLMWSRPEDIMHDIYRAPARARMNAAVDKSGRIRGLQIKIASPSSAREQSQRLVRGKDRLAAMAASGGEADIFALDGADVPYDIPHLTIDHHPVALPIPTGDWRGNANSTNAFFVESFIDELAAIMKIEPLSFRMQMISGQPRLARCLTGVAAMAGWDGGMDGSGQGLACHTMHGGYIAVVVKASRTEQGLRVKRISAMVDVGRIIHPDITRQQIEGGLVFGLAMAVGSATGFFGGLPTARRLSDLSLPRLAEIPEIQVEFVRSDEDPVGYEELGVPAVAPAIASALFSATGVRFRKLPLFAEEV